MNVAEMITQVRWLIDDQVEPYLVDSERMVQLFDRAQKQFAERTFCLTATRDSVRVAKGTELVHLPRNTVQIRRISTDEDRLIEPVTLNAISSGYVVKDYGLQNVSSWETLTGRPRFAVTDMAPQHLRLVPTPEDALTLYIDSYIYPDSLTEETDVPEIPEVWHHQLAHYVLAEIFSSRDYELYDAGSASLYSSLWARALQEGSSLTELQRRGPGVVSFSRTGVW